MGQFAILEPASWLPAISVSRAVLFHLVPTAVLSGHRYSLTFTNTLQLEFCNGHDATRQRQWLVSLVPNSPCSSMSPVLWPVTFCSSFPHIQIGSHGQGDGLRCGWSAPVLSSSAGLFELPWLLLGDLFDLLCSSYTVCLSDYLFLSFYKGPKVIFKNQII